MKFTPLSLKGAFLIEIESQADARGFFARSFCIKELAKAGLPNKFVQSSFSFNAKKNTLRGMHYQISPHEEEKIVSCTRGSIFDVIIDMRTTSLTYLKWHSEILSQENFKQIFVPKGFAHGFQTLEEETLVSYNISQFYEPNSARGLKFDDPKFDIKWPQAEQRIISERDLNYAPL
ncbi:MAG: dTDP-4-dehydrorhamnose 3,5-epimerase [Pseudomonadota bacterium]|nr:dTDP-4-dehydrorhamnose 3,5-epimerase [Pseudomonadota bacterium]